MPGQAQTELFKRVFEGHQPGIDPDEYNAERRNTLEDQMQSGFWLQNHNDDKPYTTAKIYEAGRQIGSLLFPKIGWDEHGAQVVLRTGGLQVEAGATHAAHVIESVIKRVALQ